LKRRVAELERQLEQKATVDEQVHKVAVWATAAAGVAFGATGLRCWRARRSTSPQRCRPLTALRFLRASQNVPPSALPNK
jgi:thiosulfate reductase cytochrome b subunit